MFLMASAGFGFTVLADNPGLQWWAHQFMHVEWEGFGIWDLIQPSFIFIVGVAMPFAFAIRSGRGESRASQFGHAAKRSLTLLIIGMAIVCVHKDKLVIDFITVLQQIAIAYFFAFFVLGRGWKVQALTALAVLAVHHLLYMFGPGHGAEIYAKNANFAAWLDYTVLGTYNAGGYTSFNAFSSIATVILGIIAGEMIMRENSENRKVLWMFVTGVLLIAAGAALHPVIPVVKRIWTSSWTLFAGGWAFLLLGAFYWAIEVKGWRKWSFIFQVVGMNSIAIYVFHQMLRGSLDKWLWVFTRPFLGSMGDIGVILQSWMVLAIQWFFVYWLFKREIFLKVG
jgi:predicted acyltransferase